MKCFSLQACCCVFLFLWSGLCSRGEVSYFEIIPDMPPALEADVMQFEPDAQIIEPGDYRRQGDKIAVRSTAAVGGNLAWVRIRDFWIEPITPPANRPMPEISPVEMRLYEVYGKVSITPPGEGAVAQPAANGMLIENGSIINTRDASSVAVLIGGLNSVRFGPESQGSVRFILRPRKRVTNIVLERGIAFSKVGKQQGIQQTYTVRTSRGVAEAQSTDFVTVLTRSRMDVWIAHGEVVLSDIEGKFIARGSRANYGGRGETSGLAILRTPPIDKPIEVMNANSQSITMAVRLIPSLNLKLNELKQAARAGRGLHPAEEAYLKRIPPLVYLRKVRRVGKPK